MAQNLLYVSMVLGEGADEREWVARELEGVQA